MNWGNKIKWLLKNRKIEQKAIAEQINSPQANLSYWISKEYPPLEGIEKICKALDMPLWEFFQTESDKKKLPSYITPGMDAMLQQFDTLKPATQKKIAKMWLDVLYLVLDEDQKEQTY